MMVVVVVMKGVCVCVCVCVCVLVTGRVSEYRQGAHSTLCDVVCAIFGG